jgi:hypothetical protein
MDLVNDTKKSVNRMKSGESYSDHVQCCVIAVGRIVANASCKREALLILKSGLQPRPRLSP